MFREEQPSDLVVLLLDTGWSPEAVADLVDRIDPGSPDVPPSDEVPEPPGKPFSTLGDVWVLGEHRVACGDSTDVGVHDALLGSDVPDMVLTDPPYGMHLTADWSSIKGSLKSIGAGKTSGNKYDDVIGDHDDFDPQPYLGMYDRVKEQFWFGADYYAERIPTKNDGSWLVWDKRKDSQADAIGAEFELCWSRQKHKRRMLRHDWFGFLASGTNASDARHRVHPTQKPVSLFVDIMDQWGKPRDLVLDPFGGSGSTLMACEYTGRKARLIELDPRYVDVICRRWQEYSGALPILESTGNTHDFKGGVHAESS
jgi:DNA modification methylase